MDNYDYIAKAKNSRGEYYPEDVSPRIPLHDTVDDARRLARDVGKSFFLAAFNEPEKYEWPDVDLFRVILRKNGSVGIVEL